MIYYIREHNLVERTTKTLFVTSNEQEAHTFAKNRVGDLNKQRPCFCLLSVDDNMNEKHNYDEMIATILDEETRKKVREGNRDPVSTGNSQYPTLQVID